MTNQYDVVPGWSKIRPKPWVYMGWIARGDKLRDDLLHTTFEKLCVSACKSDHDETREVDIYPEGATCWMKEKDQ